jgi:Secretion system C-terminal sorting domain
MKKRIIPLLFFAGLSFYSQMLKAQTTISNTATSITLFDLFASACQINVPAGNYKLTVKYLSGPNVVTYASTGNTAVVSSTLINGVTNLFINGAACVPLPNFPNLNSAAQSGSIQLESPGGNFFYHHNAGQITCVPLPITLVSFTGQITGTTVTLDWKTDNEYNVSYIQVQRSADGITYTSIGQVAPTNTSVTHTYQFVDNSPVYINNYYRLKTVDFDGKFSYSPIVIVKCSQCTRPPLNCNLVSITGSSNLLCSPTTYGLGEVSSYNGAPGYGAITYNWSSSNSGIASLSSNTSRQTTLNRVLPYNTNNTVTLTATTSACPNYTFGRVISVDNITYTQILGPGIFCSSADQSINISGLVSGTSPITWSLNNTAAGLSCTTCNAVTVSKINDAKVTLTATINTACAAAPPITVTKDLYMGNALQINTSLDPTCSGAYKYWYVNAAPSMSASNYNWSVNYLSSPTSSINIYNPSSPTTTISVKGGGTVRLNYTDYCGIARTTGITVYSSCPPSFAFKVAASPNPAKGSLNVNLSKVEDTSATPINAKSATLLANTSGITKLYLYDFNTNALVKQWTYQEMEALNYNLNIAGIRAGVYMLKMERDNKSTITKLIIQ